MVINIDWFRDMVKDLPSNEVDKLLEKYPKELILYRLEQKFGRSFRSLITLRSYVRRKYSIQNPVVLMTFGEAKWYGFYNSEKFRNLLLSTTGERIIELMPDVRGVVPPKEGTILVYKIDEEDIPYGSNVEHSEKGLTDWYVTKVYIVDKNDVKRIVKAIQDADTKNEVYSVRIMDLFGGDSMLRVENKVNVIVLKSLNLRKRLEFLKEKWRYIRPEDVPKYRSRGYLVERGPRGGWRIRYDESGRPVKSQQVMSTSSVQVPEPLMNAIKNTSYEQDFVNNLKNLTSGDKDKALQSYYKLRELLRKIKKEGHIDYRLRNKMYSKLRDYFRKTYGFDPAKEKIEQSRQKIESKLKEESRKEKWLRTLQDNKVQEINVERGTVKVEREDSVIKIDGKLNVDKFKGKASIQLSPSENGYNVMGNIEYVIRSYNVYRGESIKPMLEIEEFLRLVPVQAEAKVRNFSTGELYEYFKVPKSEEDKWKKRGYDIRYFDGEYIVVRRKSGGGYTYFGDRPVKVTVKMNGRFIRSKKKTDKLLRALSQIFGRDLYSKDVLDFLMSG